MEHPWKYTSYNPELKKYLLCLNKRLKIIHNRCIQLLNQRTENIAKCQYKNKFESGNSAVGKKTVE